MEKSSGLTIRMDQELHDKFKYVAEYEGRSMSKQILQLITACVRDFEKKNGVITEEDMGKNGRS